MKYLRRFFLASFLLLLLIFVFSQLLMVRFRIESRFAQKFSISPMIGNLFLIKSGLWTKVRQIDFVITPEKQNVAQNYDDTDNTLISSMNYAQTGSKIRITANFNSTKLVQVIEEKDRINNDLLFYLCVAIKKNTYDTKVCSQQVTEFINWKNRFGFNDFVGKERKITLTLVKTVLAQCSGTVNCGFLANRCTCSQPAFSCGAGSYTGSKCGAGGSCTCRWECLNTVGTLNCSGLSSRATCENVTASQCSVGDCISAEATCTWCTDSDQGCGAYGCPPNTRRLCNTCTGCQCVLDASCGPPPPSCGDGSCNGTETCSTCSTDCGSCCDANLWGACSVSCGTGTQFNECGTPRSCTVSTCSAWWQVKDGDVATNGNLNSSLPVAGLFFDTKGAGDFPGVPAYGGTTNLTTSNVSETGWLANSTYNTTKVYNSNYFANAVPADVVINSLASSIEGTDIASGGTATDGIYWYEYDSALNGGVDLTINSSASLGSRKVVLIVKDADVYLKGNINLTKGSGFFLLATSGNIIVDPGVGGGASANLEGIYVSDGTFQTGVASNQLWLRGNVAAYGGITLERDLGTDNTTTPAELFEFAPDLAILFPGKIAARSVSWQEVAP